MALWKNGTPGQVSEGKQDPINSEIVTFTLKENLWVLPSPFPSPFPSPYRCLPASPQKNNLQMGSPPPPFVKNMLDRSPPSGLGQINGQINVRNKSGEPLPPSRDTNKATPIIPLTPHALLLGCKSPTAHGVSGAQLLLSLLVQQSLPSCSRLE